MSTGTEDIGSIFQVLSFAQSYDWGKLASSSSSPAHEDPSESKVAQFTRATWAQLKKDGLLDKLNEKQRDLADVKAGKPYAELWMGTHPTLPSLLLPSLRPLYDHLASNPSLLGSVGSSDKFKAAGGGKGELPFLFKVLAIRKALSVQAHPDRELARKLYETKGDIYKDPNHKPEMALALTPFRGFCGFRPLPEIASYLSTVPELRSLVGDKLSSSFISASTSASASGSKAALKELFAAVMEAPAIEVSTLLRALVARYKNAKQGEDTVNPKLAALVVELDKQFPDDVGVFCVFLLNVVELLPGQAVFLRANEPHAYIAGDIMECMAASDNVVRAGLTPKLRDVPTLVNMLTYASGPADSQVMRPVPFSSDSHPNSSADQTGGGRAKSSQTILYDPPIDEFSVLLSTVTQGEEETHRAIDGPSILIATSGRGVLCSQATGSKFELDVPGKVWFVGAGTEVVIKAEKESDEPLVVYRAFVEV